MLKVGLWSQYIRTFNILKLGILPLDFPKLCVPRVKQSMFLLLLSPFWAYHVLRNPGLGTRSAHTDAALLEATGSAALLAQAGGARKPQAAAFNKLRSSSANRAVWGLDPVSIARLMKLY